MRQGPSQAVLYAVRMSYVLHYAPDNASLIIRIALEEVGAPYETVLVDRSQCAQFSAAHRALNPAGRIPVLVAGGLPLFETAAILIWLSDFHAGLLPEPGAPARASTLSWLLFLSNDLQSLMRLHFYTERYVDAELVEPMRRGFEHSFLESFALLETAAGDTAFFASDTPSALDCYLGPLLRWSVLYPKTRARWFDLQAFPRLARIARALEARASVQRVAHAEGLGPRPFTDPRPARPREGVAQ